MSTFRLAASYQDHTDLSQRPPLPNWLLRHQWVDVVREPAGPLRSSWFYWTKLYWATPPWLTEAMRADMRRIYETCPPGHNVDHIVPLKSDIVCGLHVPWNLQHLPFEENMRKSNTWWPDHPFENQDLFDET